MNDLKKAYEIMGLEEEANKDEISKKYSVMLKKFTIAKKEGNNKVNGVTFEEVTQAYNYLMGYSDFKPDLETQKLEKLKENSIYKKLNIDPEKVSNFFHYHKLHIIIGIIGVIMLYSIISSMVTNKEADINIGVVGDIYVTEQQLLQEMITERFPDMEEIVIMSMNVGKDAKSEMDFAVQQKIMVEMAVGELDLCLMDKWNYVRFAKIGAFHKLDSLAEELEIDMEENKDYIVKADGKDGITKGLFGVNVSNSEILKEAEVEGDEIIATVRILSENYDESIKILKFLLNK